MKILITSGGTKIPIDRVRSITNMSKGTFGAKIAMEFLNLGHDVIFLKSEGSKTPFSYTFNFYEGGDAVVQESYWMREIYLKCVHRYKENTYDTFDNYQQQLKFLIGVYQPDAILLAAAVSDYGVENYFNGKIRSNDDLTIKLRTLPKLIYYAREWSKLGAKLIGFKLLVDSRDYELIAAAKRSIEDNKCDMIVANDLAEIKLGSHRIHLVFPGDKEPVTYKTDPNDPNYLARMVAENTVRL